MLQNGETTCTTCSTVPGIMYYLAMQRSGVCVHTKLCTTGTHVQHYKGIIPTIKSKIGNFVLRYMMYECMYV